MRAPPHRAKPGNRLTTTLESAACGFDEEAGRPFPKSLVKASAVLPSFIGDSDITPVVKMAVRALE
jgi:hypothetical protein